MNFPDRDQAEAKRRLQARLEMDDECAHVVATALKAFPGREHAALRSLVKAIRIQGLLRFGLTFVASLFGRHSVTYEPACTALSKAERDFALVVGRGAE